MKRFVFALVMLFIPLSAEQFHVDLLEFGKIVYHEKDGLCTKVERFSKSGEVRYEHLYHYDGDKKLVGESLIGGLGKVEYFASEIGVSKGEEVYFQESNLRRVYDKQGRLIKKGDFEYVYEGENLVEVLTPEHAVFYEYNEEGKKVSKKVVFSDREEEEFYLYLGDHEIGSISAEGNLKWLRIPGLSSHEDLVRAVAIETEDAVYAPIYDDRYNFDIFPDNN